MVNIFERWPSRRWILILFPVVITLLIVGHFTLASLLPQIDYPGSSFAAQFSFDGQLLKEHYSILSIQGTLHLYVNYQWLDFIFIAGMFGTLLFIGIVYARSHPENSLIRRISLWMIPFLLLSPIMDVVETIAVLIMLANPETFSDYWAYLRAFGSIMKYVFGPVLGCMVTLMNMGAHLIAIIRKQELHQA